MGISASTGSAIRALLMLAQNRHRTAEAQSVGLPGSADTLARRATLPGNELATWRGPARSGGLIAASVAQVAGRLL
ncbi:MAG: hypothetical protein ABI903_02220 [Actinomycetota bacterium]